ncbi:MAG: hypothetical protein R3B65_02745 [Candidatus Paceibacterota bacterium]
MNTIKWVLLVAIAIILVVVFTGKDKKEDMMEDTLVMEENAVLLWTNSQEKRLWFLTPNFQNQDMLLFIQATHLVKRSSRN